MEPLPKRIGDRYGIEVWAYYHGGADRWELDWTRTAAGEPTAEQLTKVITGDPVTAGYIDDLELDTESGAAVRWARRMLTPGWAVILDTVIHTGVVVSTHGRPNVALWLAAA